MNKNLCRRFAISILNFSVRLQFQAISNSTNRTAMSKPRVVPIPDRSDLERLTDAEEKDLQAAVDTAVESLKKGSIVAVPTDTIYGIAGLAQNSQAVNRIYTIKNRNYAKPVAISVGNIEDLYRWSKIAVSRQVLEDLLPGPVTVVSERSPELNPLLNPGTNLIGIRIPDHAFMRRLAQKCGSPVVLTSANRSAAQSTLCLDEFEYLWSQLDLLVDGGLLNDSEESRLGSTVVDLSQTGKFQIIREGSAYKNTVDILKNKYKMEEISSSS